VRNFWIDGQIEGRESGIGTGPKAKDGGFTLYIKQRNDGDIETPLRIEGIADSNGNLTLVAFSDGKKVFEHTTKR
jgi:hypothetical protein